MTIGVLLLFALATSIQIFLVTASVRDRALEQWRAGMHARSDSAVLELQQAVAQLRRDVLFLSQVLAEFPSSRAIDPPPAAAGATPGIPLDELLLAFARAHPAYDQVRFIGIANDGRELIRVNQLEGKARLVPRDQLQAKADRDYFAAASNLAAGDVYLSEINLNREHGALEVPHHPVLRAATAVFSPRGEKIGIAVINMGFAAAIGNLSIGLNRGVRTYLTNQDGDFLVHPDPSRTFGFDLGERHRWSAEFDEAASAKFSPARSSGMQGFVLSGALLFGIQRRLHFDPLQQTRFMTLTYAVPDRFLEERAAEARNLSLLSSTGAAAFVGLLIFLYIRRAFVPLRQLTVAANEVGGGNYAPALPASGNDDIGQLNAAFRQMLERVSARGREVRQMNQRLAQSEKFLTLIIDTVPEGILVVQGDGTVLRANSRIEQLFGRAPSTLIGRSVETLIPPRFRAQHPALRHGYGEAPTQRLMGGGRDLYGLRADGREVPVEVGLAPLILDDERLVVVSIVDISERKEDELRRSLLIEELNRANEDLTQFAYAAAHDLKSPLRGLDQLASWIAEDMGEALSKDTRTHISLMRGRILRMEQLLDDLLAYSRVGRDEREMVRIDTHELVQGVFDLMAKDKPVELRFSNRLPTLVTSKIALELVFRNLIGNAIKHNDKADGLIEVSSRPSPGGVEFAVRDNGPGIEPQYQNRVFAMFQTLQPRDKTEGSGIGLALVRKTVLSEGGVVRLESDGANGCIFRFTWPNTSQENAPT